MTYWIFNVLLLLSDGSVAPSHYFKDQAFTDRIVCQAQADAFNASPVTIANDLYAVCTPFKGEK